MSNPPIAEMLASLPSGATRTYPAVDPGSDGDERFFEVHQFISDAPALVWPKWPGILNRPLCGDRVIPPVGIDLLLEYSANIVGLGRDAAEFYKADSDLYFLSQRLVDLIREYDSDAIVHRPAKVSAFDKEVQFYAVMPARVIEAVDVDFTEVTVSKKVMRSGKASFESSVTFRSDIADNVHAFKDPDLYFWHWSRSLLLAAKAAGIRGIYANRMTARRQKWIAF